MKQTLIWFNLQRDRTGNGLSNIKDTFAENVHLQTSVLHLKYEYLQGAGLSSSYVSYDDGQAKYKEKDPDVLDPNQMLKQCAIPNPSLHNLKTYSSKGAEKLATQSITNFVFMQLTQQF